MQQLLPAASERSDNATDTMPGSASAVTAATGSRLGSGASPWPGIAPGSAAAQAYRMLLRTASTAMMPQRAGNAAATPCHNVEVSRAANTATAYRHCSRLPGETCSTAAATL